MRNEILTALLNTPHADGDRLPSVRELMSLFKASSATVQAALRILLQEGKITCEQGRGNFWGVRTKKVLLPVKESVEMRLEREFQEDFEKGFLSINKPLPMLKGLYAHYGISQKKIRQFLLQKVKDGVLERRGRTYEFIKTELGKQKKSLAELLFVTRCDPVGSFSSASEREMDFLRFVYRKAGASRYKLQLLGFDERTESLRDRNGRIVHLQDFPHAVGALLSTLLVFKPHVLLHLFAPLKIPMAFWWEHPESMLPKVFLKKENMFFFNSSFGKNPGIEMGKYLRKHGISKVVYLSPYHNSSWSKDRLVGLNESGVETIIATDANAASPYDFKQMAVKQVEKYMVDAYARELTKKRVLELFNTLPFSAKQLPYVCVNDEVADILMELADSNLIDAPSPLFAFDNSSESYLFRVPSYDFNTETLVEQMFYAIECPSDFMQKNTLLQIRGNVVEK